MQLLKGATVVVADGERLLLFRNTGDERNPTLVALSDVDVGSENKTSGVRHQSSSANPDDSRLEEDSFAAGVADFLNRQVLNGDISDLVIIAAPRTLGELRKNYHKKLSSILVGEIAKDLTGHSVHDIEKTITDA